MPPAIQTARVMATDVAATATMTFVDAGGIQFADRRLDR